MMQSAIRQIAVVVFAGLALTACALAQDHSPQDQSAPDHSALLGKWNMTSENDGDPVRWSLTLKDVDGKLTAALATPDGEAEAKDFSYIEGVLRFKAPYQQEYYDIELKFGDGKLDGTWSGGGHSGHTYGTRRAVPTQ